MMDPRTLGLAQEIEAVATAVAASHRSPWMRMRVGLLCALVGLMGRAALDPLLGDHLPFAVFFPAVLMASLFGGLPGAAAALLLTTLGGWFFFIPERWSWAVAAGKGWQVYLYVALGSGTAATGLVLRTALIRLEAHRRRHEALVAELNGRLRKDLAVIEAIARRTLRGAEDRRGGEAFVDRLGVIRETHADLGSADWERISLRRVIERPLRYFSHAAGAITIEGSDLALDADLAIGIALSMWELAEQSRRQGALSVPGGRAHVSWKRDGEAVDLAWTEISTEASAAPSKGFAGNFDDQGLAWRSQRLADGMSWSLRFHAASSERQTTVVPLFPAFRGVRARAS